MSDCKVNVFISYSHIDIQWFTRLQVHLRPLARDYDIDVWEDTRIRSGSKWRKEIRSAVERANVAILLISADFLASEFIHTDELPPLLKAAEEEGVLILPIIVAPCLYLRTPEISQFQCVNDPARPLVAVGQGEQEFTFVNVAESILDLAHTHQIPIENNSVSKHEAFLDGDIWNRLIKIGDWIFDQANSTIIGSGMNAYLLSRHEFGKSPFEIQVRLSFSNFEKYLEHDIAKMNAGIVIGWNSDKPNPRYLNIMLTGEEILVEKIGYRGGETHRDFEHITKPISFPIAPFDEYLLTIRVGIKQLEVIANNSSILTFERPTGLVGRAGLRPWRSQVSCKQFNIIENNK